MIACNKYNNVNQVYSQWKEYNKIEGYVYFKIYSLTIDLKNEIYFSAFVREDWVGSNSFKIFKIVSDSIIEIDTSYFSSDYTYYSNDSIEKKIWLNDELVFMEYNNGKDPSKWHVSNIKNKLHSSPVQNDSLGNIWIASENYYYSINDGIQKYDGKIWITYFLGTDFWAICFDNYGNMYASTLPDFNEPGIVMKYDYKSWDTIVICSQNADWVPCMHFDKNNNLWCGVLSRNGTTPESGDGLIKYDGNNITRYNIYNSSLPSNSVVDIDIDKFNNKWVAMYSGGIAKLTSGGQWKIFDPNNTPMKISSVEVIAVDDFDNVWFSDHFGLTRIKE